MPNITTQPGWRVKLKKFRYLLISSLIFIIVFSVFFTFAVPSVAAQSKARSLPELSAAAAGQIVLLFSPHPDDETIALGGYIAQSVINGAEVVVVLVTDGNKMHNMATRYSEFKTATSILGIPETDLVFLNLPDGALSSENQTKLQKMLGEQIDFFNPNVVIYPNPRDYNPDHAAIGRAMKLVLKNKPDTIVRYEYLVHYEIVYPRPYSWKFRTGLSLLPPNDLIKPDTEWLKFSLSQDLEDLKEKALMSYKSQFRSIELSCLLHSSVRKNELVALPGP
jgi:N-acetylglucosamine malate deacetylase 1